MTKVKNPFLDDVLRNDDAQHLIWSRPRVVYDEANPPPKVGLVFDENDPRAASLTDVSQARSCDVNEIVKIGVHDVPFNPALYGDFVHPGDYKAALDMLNQTQDQFDSFSAEMRLRFENDPAKFLEFVEDPKNAQELVRLGLATSAPETSSEAPEAPLKPAQAKKTGNPTSPASSSSPKSDD